MPKATTRAPVAPPETRYIPAKLRLHDPRARRAAEAGACQNGRFDLK